VWTVGDAGCSDADTVQVTFQDAALPVFVDAGADQELDVTTTTQLSGSAAPGAEVVWSLIQGGGNILSPTDTASWVSELGVGTNILMLTASIGECAQATDTMMITVNDVFIPQGFSPDGDGVNEVFEITGIRAFPGNHLAVFNRWGQAVLDRTDYQNDWDGHGMNGEPLPNDTYFYVLNLTPDRAYNGFVIIKR
jgi:gliding motility-associated-like protein